MLTLIRDQRIDAPSRGVLLGAGDPIETLELPWRENATSISCVPAGRYVLQPHVSPSQGPCLHVSDTTPRTHILVHAGNTRRDTRGCILVGERRGTLRVRDVTEDAVLLSRIALRRLLGVVTAPIALDIVLRRESC